MSLFALRKWEGATGREIRKSEDLSENVKDCLPGQETFMVDRGKTGIPRIGNLVRGFFFAFLRRSSGRKHWKGNNHAEQNQPFFTGNHTDSPDGIRRGHGLG